MIDFGLSPRIPDPLFETSDDEMTATLSQDGNLMYTFEAIVRARTPSLECGGCDLAKVCIFTSGCKRCLSTNRKDETAHIWRRK